MNSQYLVGLHVREILPEVRRVVRDPRALAVRMGVDEVAGDQIGVGEAARTAPPASPAPAPGPGATR